MTRRRGQMRYVLAIAILPLAHVGPALAAPQWVEDACWAAAIRVRPALRFEDVEAYVAGCIANWTAGTPLPPRNSKNTNRNRY
jgi:hypothetical protein